MPTIFRHLEQAGKRWAYYTPHIPTAFPQVITELTGSGNITDFSNFAADARSGHLPAVAWVEPDWGLLPPHHASDDHPGADVSRGQELVASVYDVLRDPTHGLWEKTLFIVVYDEHGGLYDHVVPPPAEDDREGFQSYGVRVPAFLVSPWAPRGQATHRTFDHTSILRTILTRFCVDAAGNVPSMGRRTDSALDLWADLSLPAPRDDAPTSVRPPAPAATVAAASAVTGTPDTNALHWTAVAATSARIQLGQAEAPAPPPKPLEAR
jgi:phospholipase C